VRLAVVGLATAAMAWSGCWDSCPYQVDALYGEARSAADLDLANATLAAGTLRDMGFAVTQDGLWVQGERDDVQVFLAMDGIGGTSLRVAVDLGHAEFRSYERALRYVEARRADAEARMNATVADFDARIAWPPFTPLEPEAGAVSVC
jgi:hypothetical protein